MRVSEIMTARVETVAPDDTIQHAAQMMDDLNVGALPVCVDGRLAGIVTDRDITVRATSVGKAPDGCRVEEVMTDEVDFVFADETVREASDKMKSRQIRRLPVVDADRRLIGILSLGDIATDTGDEQVTSQTLERISEPSRPDRSVLPHDRH